MDEKQEKALEKHVQRQMRLTVKLFPNTHKKLKLIAASKETTIEKIATGIIEEQFQDFDIVDFVEKAFEYPKEFEEGYDWIRQEDADNSAYDLNDKILKKGRPRKRINVKVDSETHKKLRVISAIQDRSLDKLVGSMIENEIGDDTKINASKLMDEILLVLMLN